MTSGLRRETMRLWIKGRKRDIISATIGSRSSSVQIDAVPPTTVPPKLSVVLCRTRNSIHGFVSPA
jgi:hypothetical protein